MNISKEQKYSLKAWLDKQLKYREVFDEVYDHILSAMEKASEGTDFEAAYLSYIDNEFGGETGLQALERRNRRQIFNAMRQRYFSYVKEQGSFPAICAWMMLAIISYSTFSAAWFNTEWYFGVYFFLSLAPVMIGVTRYLKAGYILGSTKRSVADDVFRWLKYFQQLTLTVLMGLWIFGGLNYVAGFSKMPTILAAGFFTVYLLHITSVYKLYKHEFKVVLAG